MKKKYVVPELYFESYTLSQSVAGGCDAAWIEVIELEMDLGGFTSSNPSNKRGIGSCKDTTTGDSYWGSGANLFLS